MQLWSGGFTSSSSSEVEAFATELAVMESERNEVAADDDDETDERGWGSKQWVQVDLLLLFLPLLYLYTCSLQAKALASLLSRF